MFLLDVFDQTVKKMKAQKANGRRKGFFQILAKLFIQLFRIKTATLFLVPMAKPILLKRTHCLPIPNQLK
jgi:hypothetical protein